MSVGEGDEAFELSCEAQRFPIQQTHLLLNRLEKDGRLMHEVVGNPMRERHLRLLGELQRHNVDPDLSIRAATDQLRAHGVKVGKGRIPTETWETYKAGPRAFDLPEGVA
jgi:hypothetical protein